MINLIGLERDSTIQNINPSDIIIYNERVFIAINKIENGYLLKDMSSGKCFPVDENRKIKIVSNIEIQ